MGNLKQINGVTALIGEVGSASPDMLREMADWFRNAVKSGVLVLGSITEDKPQLCVAVTDDLTKQYHAGNLIKQLAPIVGGGGGGRPNLALAGGKDAGKLNEALAQAALRDLLADQGYLVPFRPFFVSLAESDDTATDLSINHDRYLTEGDAGGSG